MPLLTAARVREILRILIEQAKKEDPGLEERLRKENKKLYSHVFDEKIATRLLDRVGPTDELLTLAKEGHGIFSELTKDVENKETRLELYEKVKKAFKAFIHDMHVYGCLREMHDKITIARIGSEGPVNPNILSFAPYVDPLSQGSLETIINIDTRGYTRVATDPNAQLTSKELHERQANIILGLIEREAARFGIKRVYKGGDAIILYGESGQDALYFVHGLGTSLREAIRKKLEASYDGRIKRLENRLAKFDENQAKIVVYKEEIAIGKSFVKEQRPALERRLAFLKERKAALEKHALKFRCAVTQGELYHGEDEDDGTPDISGQAIMKSDRYMTHVKGVENPVYDVRFENSVLDNQAGNVVAGDVVENLVRHVKVHAPHTITEYHGIELPEGICDIIVHHEDDGRNVVYRSLTPEKVLVGEFEDRIWKISLNADELKGYAQAIQEAAKKPKPEPPKPQFKITRGFGV